MAMTYTLDDRVKFESANGRNYWARLDHGDATAFRKLRASEALLSALSMARRTGRVFGCCDIREVGVLVEAGDQPISIPVEVGETVDTPVLDLFRMANRNGVEYFGNRYNVSIPEPEP